MNKNGEIITFYSFKGGVGRSRALANVAYQLARNGKEVLCVDFDLEAPGLEEYFAKWPNRESSLSQNLGLIDIFCRYKEFLLSENKFSKILNWRDLVKQKEISDNTHIDFLGPGKQNAEYSKKVTTFDWEQFYSILEGDKFIEHLRTEFRNEYDYVLIDSRTGITDVGGICTVQFPTILVFVFSSSPQSVRGIERIFESITAQHRNLRGEHRIPIIPLPSRVDRQEEYNEYRAWFNKLINSKLVKVLEPYKGIQQIENILQRLTINYVPKYSYTDDLESEHEKVDDIGANAFRYKSLIELINLIQITQSEGESISISKDYLIKSSSKETNFSFENIKSQISSRIQDLDQEKDIKLHEFSRVFFGQLPPKDR